MPKLVVAVPNCKNGTRTYQEELGIRHNLCRRASLHFALGHSKLEGKGNEISLHTEKVASVHMCTRPGNILCRGCPHTISLKKTRTYWAPAHMKLMRIAAPAMIKP